MACFQLRTKGAVNWINVDGSADFEEDGSLVVFYDVKGRKVFALSSDSVGLVRWVDEDAQAS